MTVKSLCILRWAIYNWMERKDPFKDYSCELEYRVFRLLYPVIHGDLIWHKCPFCGKEYTRASGLETHIMRYHRLEWISKVNDVVKVTEEMLKEIGNPLEDEEIKLNDIAIDKRIKEWLIKKGYIEQEEELG